MHFVRARVDEGDDRIANDETAGNFVVSILYAPGGILWFGTFGWVTRFDGETFTNFTTEEGLAANRVYAIERDDEGHLWLGTEGGVSHFDGKTFTNFTTENGLVHNTVWAIERDDEDFLWLGTEGGVSRFDGKTWCSDPAGLTDLRFTNFTTENGLAHNDVRAIYCDGDGIVWFSTMGGAVSYFDGTAWASLDRRDGLLGNLVRALAQGADGAMWFGSDRGATRYQRRTAHPPGARIVAVQTDRRHTDLDALGPVTAGTRTTFEYAAIDLKSLPEKRRYRCRVARAEPGTASLQTD